MGNFAAEFLDLVPSGPAALSVHGEPGIGKSALWASAVQRAERREFLVLAAQAALAETRLALTVLADLRSDIEVAVFDRLSRFSASQSIGCC